MEFDNVYADARLADAYARLQFPGTYYLAFRDLPAILRAHVRRRRALDLGCGAGRSTRFLKDLGFSAVGVDIAEEMLRHARSLDPDGDYRAVGDGDLADFRDGTFDLVLSAFTFDNVPTMDARVRILGEMKGVLRRDGVVVTIVSTPEIYVHEWASFTTRDFPENREARCGDPVKIVGTDVDDDRPVVDILWPDEDYREAYRRVGLKVVEHHRPLGRDGEPVEWVNETRIAPWSIYVLGR